MSAGKRPYAGQAHQVSAAREVTACANDGMLPSKGINEVEGIMTVMMVNVAENGRMVLPAEVRRALGVHGPGQLRVEVTDDGVQITTPRQALLRARERVRKLVPADRNLTEELIADRQKEVEAEGSDNVADDSQSE